MLSHILVYLSLTLPFLASAKKTPHSTAQLWNFTAISADAQHNSVIECWQTTSPLKPIGNGGISYTAFNVAPEVAFAVFPPHDDAGLHNAMNPQWIVVLSGLAKISIPAPGSDDTFTDHVTAGPGALILATDTANISTRGHESTWPSGKATTSLMLNTNVASFPPHTVLHQHACTEAEIKF